MLDVVSDRQIDDAAQCLDAFDVPFRPLLAAGHCPALSVLAKHSHMSEVYSVNTADESVTAPILKWMKKRISLFYQRGLGLFRN